jgi:hypothetical protein
MGFATVEEITAMLSRLAGATSAESFHSAVDWRGMLEGYLKAYGGKPVASAPNADAAIAECRAMLPKIRDDTLYADLKALLADLRR